jgi:hypothetical protein
MSRTILDVAEEVRQARLRHDIARMIDPDDLTATSRTLAIRTIVLLWIVGFACGWFVRGWFVRTLL